MNIYIYMVSFTRIPNRILWAIVFRNYVKTAIEG